MTDTVDSLREKVSSLEENFKLCRGRLDGFGKELKVLFAEIQIITEWISDTFGLELINKKSFLFKHISDFEDVEEIAKTLSLRGPFAPRTPTPVRLNVPVSQPPKSKKTKAPMQTPSVPSSSKAKTPVVPVSTVTKSVKPRQLRVPFEEESDSEFSMGQRSPSPVSEMDTAFQDDPEEIVDIEKDRPKRLSRKPIDYKELSGEAEHEGAFKDQEVIPPVVEKKTKETTKKVVKRAASTTPRKIPSAGPSRSETDSESRIEPGGHYSKQGETSKSLPVQQKQSLKPTSVKQEKLSPVKQGQSSKSSQVKQELLTKSTSPAKQGQSSKSSPVKSGQPPKSSPKKQAQSSHSPARPTETMISTPVAAVPKRGRPKKRPEDRVRTYDPKLPMQCDECGKVLKGSGALRVHKQIHSNIRPHECKECGKAFRRKHHLDFHMMIHAGDKKETCSFCGKSFLIRRDLVRHERTHTGEKPFSCHLCPKSFNVKQHLTLHIRTHTGERPYRCPICDKTFSQANSLRIHKKIHTRERGGLSNRGNIGNIAALALPITVVTKASKDQESATSLVTASSSSTSTKIIITTPASTSTSHHISTRPMEIGSQRIEIISPQSTHHLQSQPVTQIPFVDPVNQAWRLAVADTTTISPGMVLSTSPQTVIRNTGPTLVRAYIPSPTHPGGGNNTAPSTTIATTTSTTTVIGHPPAARHPNPPSGQGGTGPFAVFDPNVTRFY